MAASRMRLSSSMSRAFGWLVVIAALALAADEARGQAPEAPAVVVQQLGEYPVGAQAEFPARVEAIEAVDVRARVQGVLEDIAFTAGERVEAGDILFRIERDQFEAGVASAHAQAARATANLTEAQAALERTRELHQRGTAAQAALDAAVAAHAMAEAEVASSKAAVRRAEIDLGYTEIRAAIAGRIGRPLITRGNVVGPESGPLARIVQLDPVRIVFSLSERQYVGWQRARLEGTPRTDAAGFTFTIRLPDGGAHPHPGTIDHIDSEVDPSTGTIPVRVTFPNPDNLLAPGQNVTLRVAEEDPPLLPVAPQSAVLQDRRGRYVYVLDGDDTVSRRDIETGARVEAGWAVTHGLAAGETVVIQGVQRLRPGMRVRPTRAEGSGS